ncbi:hypothetical protein HYH03_004261 [Edaphochlamys debaryana]|uniref:EGF-like domain-containing protein n=1 Tax=Edaphochlamys debaryana TaxID=47281 RepID=A0A835Y833_9CHLO|nr:hypothetical protein HYH03_004261 [Edaphochlamys debaryana]|eukprot:KAG2498002.1 hypothetical protein HYH03_004261 [Edaphochlamys debaryana]
MWTSLRFLLTAALLIAFVNANPTLPAPLNATGACGVNCAEHGTCNPETRICDCPLLLNGPDCSIRVQDPVAVCAQFSHLPHTCEATNRTLCLNRCHEQGWCEGGFCHCKPGFYGADCALSVGPDGLPKLLAGQGYRERKRGVKVYVYELPPVTNSWVYIRRIDRPLVPILMQRFLSSGVRTVNGDEADYYFIPFVQRSRSHTHKNLAATIAYIRKHWPWWDRHGGGHKHLLVATNDLGRRALVSEVLALTENVTFLTHWGLHRNHTVTGWHESHRPGKDIVMPPVINPDEPIVYSPLHSGLKKEKPRVGQLFFAGRICGDGEAPVNGSCGSSRHDYSAGTRQRVAKHHWNRTGFNISTHTTAYTHGLQTHKFCLAPTGGGYGKRSVLALIMGCVPVTVTDHVYQPFQPEINWSDFSVHVPEADIPRMHDILAAINFTDYIYLQAGARCAAQHLYYSTTFGEVMGEDGRFDAFETLMEILRMRKQYPGVPPERYMKADSRFADFVTCDQRINGVKVPLCTQNRLVRGREWKHCRELYPGVPMRYMDMFYSWPGGAVCGANRRVATCPRSWA